MSLSSVLGRALPFFEGCDLGHEWVERARALSRLVRTDVAEFGARFSGSSDAERIARHAGNPLRAVPWTDLTAEEADALLAGLDALVQAAHDIAEIESIEMGQYLGDLRRQLQHGMEHLTQDESEGVLSKLESAGDLDEERVGVEEVVEVVRLLLGRQVKAAQTIGDEDQQEDTASGPDEHRVSPLRNLDVYAYFPADEEVHLTNLSDQGPSPARPEPWDGRSRSPA